jgi:hypothetical protein
LFAGGAASNGKVRRAPWPSLEPLGSPEEQLRDQGQFIVFQIERLELLGAQAVVDKMDRQGCDFLLLVLILMAQFRSQPSDGIGGSEHPAQAIVIALRPGPEVWLSRRVSLYVPENDTGSILLGFSPW